MKVLDGMSLSQICCYAGKVEQFINTPANCGGFVLKIIENSFIYGLRYIAQCDIILSVVRRDLAKANF